MKLKTMKKTSMLTTLFAVAIMFTSCENGKNKKDNTHKDGDVMTNLQNDKVTAMKNPSDDRAREDFTNQTLVLSNGDKATYKIDSKGVIIPSDWYAYNTLHTQIADIKNVKFDVPETRVANLNGLINNLEKNIPDWLKTEEIMEDVADIKKEYEELMTEKNASEKERKENIEELSEQFDDLQEEINETVNEYQKISEKALEKYNKKMEKGKIEKAEEKYKKEMKKMEKVADYEGKNES